MKYIDSQTVERLNNEVRKLLASGECDNAMHAMHCIVARNHIRIVEETDGVDLAFYEGQAVNIWWESQFGQARFVTIDNFDESGIGFDNQPLDWEV